MGSYCAGIVQRGLPCLGDLASLWDCHRPDSWRRLAMARASKKKSSSRNESQTEIQDTDGDPGDLRIKDILKISEEIEDYPVKYLRTLAGMFDQIATAFSPIRSFVSSFDRAKGQASQASQSSAAAPATVQTPPRRRNASQPSEGNADLKNQIRGVLGKQPQTIGEIAKALGLNDPKVLAPSMKALVSEGIAEQSGQARGTRYAKA